MCFHRRLEYHQQYDDCLRIHAWSLSSLGSSWSHGNQVGYRVGLWSHELGLLGSFIVVFWLLFYLDKVDYGLCSTPFSIFINGTPLDFFCSTIGLHQDCPLPPYLFICCTDMFSRALWIVARCSCLDPYMPAWVPNLSLTYYLQMIACYLAGHPFEMQWPSLRSLSTTRLWGRGWFLNLRSFSTRRQRSSFGMLPNWGWEWLNRRGFGTI